MTYYLPLEIERSRFHITALAPISEQNSDPLKHYILKKTAGDLALFDIDVDTYIVGHGGTQTDLDWKSFRVTHDEQQNQLNIYLQTTPRLNRTVRTGSFHQVVGDAPVVCRSQPIAQDAITLYFTGRAGSFEMAIHLETEHNVVTHTGKFMLHIVPNTQLWHVALDFGSEASQLLVRQDSEGGATSFTPIIQYLKTAFYKEDSKIDDKDFMQYEVDELFRSIFFLAKEGVLNSTDAPGNSNEFVPPENSNESVPPRNSNESVPPENSNESVSPENSNELVRMLTHGKHYDELNKKKYSLLPTVKLASFGIDGNVPLSVNGRPNTLGRVVKAIHQKLIFNFLHTACQAIQSDRDSYIQFKLLIPNIFNQTDVNNLVSDLEKDCVTFLKNYPEYKVKAIEFTTISESDAAFAGHLQKPEIRTTLRGKYLIIDVGRGTTDFSVVEVTAADTATSLYRSGFIGAGALLSFAFFDTFVTHILKEYYAKQEKGLIIENRRDFIEKIIFKSADLKWQIDFFKNMETLKKRFRQGDPNNNVPMIPLIPQLLDDKTAPQDILDIDTFDLRLLNQWLEKGFLSQNKHYMGDMFGFIEDTKNALADRIMKEIQKIPNEFASIQQLNGVFLSGRGFLFTPLVDELKKRFQNVEVAVVPNLKDICIQGALSTYHFNGSCNMIGIPYAAITAGDEKDKQILLPPPPPPPLPPPTWWEKLSAMLKAAPVQGTAQKENNYYKDIRRFLQGHGNPHFNPEQAAFFVSGVRYQNRRLKTWNATVNLFFTGKEFLIRTPIDAITLSPPQTVAGHRQDDDFTTKTLFPVLNGAPIPLDEEPDPII